MILIFGLVGLVSAYQTIGSMNARVQTSAPSFSSDWGINPGDSWDEFGQETCQDRKDFVVMIPPGGCTPTVVRSDLLEEQNVPVFCKLSAIQVNPLIDVSRIRGISFSGAKPEGVLSTRYYPARAYLQRERGLEGSPILDNIGYLVIVLKKNPVEEDMPDFLNGTLKAVIEYDVDNAFGIGQHAFYSRPLDNVEWEREYLDYGFWNGKGYVRVEDVQEDSARVSIYQNQYNKVQTVTLKKGETSDGIYLGGYYCAAGMNIELTNINYPVDKALLIVDDEEFWVSKGSKFLDDKCTIKDIVESKAGDSKVSIYCSDAGNFDLRLGIKKASLNVSGVVGSYEVGKKVSGNIYLGYAGYNENDKDFVVLVNSSLDENDFIESGIISFIPDNIGSSILIEKLKSDFGVSNAKVLKFEDNVWNNILVVASITGENVLKSNPQLNVYYQNATLNYDDVFDFYRDESPKNLDLLEPYGALALKREAELAGLIGLTGEQEEYLNRLIQNYPTLGISRRAELDLENLRAGQVSTESSAVVYVDNFASFISLVRVKTPGFEELGVEISIDGTNEKLELNEIDSQNKTKLIGVRENEIELEVYASTSMSKGSTNQKTEKVTIAKGKSSKVNDKLIIVRNINFNREATVKLKSFNQGTRTEVNFSFGVGIEKRAIELSPERTLKMIENLNFQIEKWGEINGKLGKVVKGLKGACFATSAMLTVKNFFSGLSGGSMARNEVMTSSGGWNDKCKGLVAQGAYKSIQSCLLDNNDLVNTDVSSYQTEIEKQNELIQKIQGRVGTTDDGIFSSGYDINKVEAEYRTEFTNFWNQNKESLEITLRDGDKVNLGDIVKNENDIKQLSIEDMKSIMTSANINNVASSDSVLKSMTGADLGDRLYSVDQTLVRTRELTNLNNVGGALGLPVSYTNSKEVNVPMGSLTGEPAKRLSNSNQAFVVQVPSTYRVRNTVTGVDTVSPIAGKNIIVGAGTRTDGNYDLKEAYVVGDNNVISLTNVTTEMQTYYGSNVVFTKTSSNLYKNQILEEGIVRYHQTAPYVGLPQLVPFDMKEGWYVATDYIVTGIGVPFEDSGRAVNFWICNVGQNGLIDFKQGDDCRYYNRGTGQAINFPGLTDDQSAEIVRRAESALLEASNQYRQGVGSVTIAGRNFNTGIAEDSTAGQCSDFMSPKECWLLFNVCDPVLCPASRCNFGGQYRVANVVQSGIVGSLLLCLPNIQEGIMVPICLTGVHAGIESYVSILNSTVECLNESLETGRNIGICDEVKSIYLCEFFWKQAVPLMDVLIPKMFELALGQGARGGGEYLTVQAAWENTQKSIDYFNNEYAVSSMQAFNIRSTEGIGSEVCKGFVSARYPNSADFLDNLVEPDSPTQFTGWFSENQLTTVTVPPLSHYKVYYHIYAGRDAGSHYIVYLSENTDAGLAQTSQSVVIDRGYIEKGSQVDEARDIELVSGYTKLCIDVNGQVVCDFGQASTSFLVNTLSDNYAASQASEKAITNSVDCVGGTSSVAGLFTSPNLQANVEGTINPEIYKQGIIRVCSSNNPGAGVAELENQSATQSKYSRWKDVGYCDDPTIRCWIDTESVNDVLSQNKQLLNATLSDIDQQGLAQYLESFNLPDDQTLAILERGKNKMELRVDLVYPGDVTNSGNLKKLLDDLDNVAENASSDEYRARALYFKGRLYDRLARQMIEGLVEQGDGGEAAAVSSEDTSVGDTDASAVETIAWEFGEREDGGVFIKLNGQETLLFMKFLEDDLYYSVDIFYGLDGNGARRRVGTFILPGEIGTWNSDIFSEEGEQLLVKNFLSNINIIRVSDGELFNIAEKEGANVKIVRGSTASVESVITELAPESTTESVIEPESTTEPIAEPVADPIDIIEPVIEYAITFGEEGRSRRYLFISEVIEEVAQQSRITNFYLHIDTNNIKLDNPYIDPVVGSYDSTNRLIVLLEEGFESMDEDDQQQSINEYGDQDKDDWDILDRKTVG